MSHADTNAIVSTNNVFTYQSDCSIDAVSPARGQRGTYVSVFGSNLLCGGSSLITATFGGVDPLQVISVPETHVTLRMVESFELGLADVEFVSDAGAVVALDNGWTFDTPSNVTSVCV